MKLIQIQGTGCYDINVTFLSSAKDNLLRFSNSSPDTFPIFPALEKKMIKLFVKWPWRFDMIMLMWSIRLFQLHMAIMTIMTNNLWKV